MEPEQNSVRATRKQATRWDTQDEAWSAIQPRVGTINAVVFASITDCPATCDELEVRLGLSHQTCSASVNSLMNDDLIVPDGKRPTRSGRKATIWRVAMPTSLFGGKQQ